MGNYVEVEEVKSFCKLSWEDLGYNSDAEFEAFLNELVSLAESVVENYCRVPAGYFKAGGLSFQNQVYDYRYALFLRYRPVLSVEKVEINVAGYGQTPSWTQLNTEEYVVDLQAGVIYLVGRTPLCELQSIRVSYTAGYSETPGIIKYVVLQLCSNILHAILQRKISPVIRVDDWSVRMLIPDVFTPELQTMLTPYVRMVIEVG